MKADLSFINFVLHIFSLRFTPLQIFSLIAYLLWLGEGVFFQLSNEQIQIAKSWVLKDKFLEF